MTSVQKGTGSRWSRAEGSKPATIGGGVAISVFAALMTSTALAGDLPSGGQVAAGDVAITTPSATQMTIQQGSNAAVVNWNDFSIGQGARVDITQPSVQATMLNRVTGATTSQIHGQLNANGTVFVVNPNGIFIGPTGHVNAGGFVASTLDITDDDFIQGRYRFEGNGRSAGVENAGQISIVPGGYAALIGGKAKNSGVIRVPLGKVGLAAGERVTLDVSGDGFLQVAVPSEGDDAMEALVENSGLIQANGGQVQMMAASARDAARQVVNMSGVIEARSVGGRSGAIVLGGSGGAVNIAGTLDTSATLEIVQTSPRPVARPMRGGDITVTGGHIDLAGATLDASGAGSGDGGLIRVGGDFGGTGNLQRALTVTVDAATRLIADGGSSGNGGRIVTWSDHFTDFAGSISVRGGENGGDGGFTEVSAKQELRYLGQADGRAPQGETGTLLLDPTDIVVDAAAASAIETTLLTINAILDTDSEGSDLGNITVNAPISWATANTLQMIADNNILINAAITGSSGGTLDATADGDITTSAGGVLNVSTIDLTSDGSVTIGGTVTSDDFDIISDGTLIVNAALNGGVIDIESNGSVTFNDDVTASSIFFDVTGTITTGAGGAFSTGVFTLFAGNWIQSAATLPAFSSTDFRLATGGGSGPEASFLRVLGGDGMPGSPYQLTDVYGLQGINTGGFAAADFELANDIDASTTRTWNFFGEGDPSGFDPIEGYSGTFNGGRFTIDGLLIERFASGLFGTLSGTVTDLRMTNADINTGSGGILAVTNSGLIRSTSVGGSVDAFTGAAGGMVGTNTSVIDDSFSTATVSMTTFSDDTLSVGGLAGVNSGTISRSHATGLVSGTETGSGPFFQMGGLVGSNQGTIQDSYAMGDVQASLVSGSAFIGGLAGINSSALTILNSYSTGAPSATGTGSATLGGLTPDTIGLVTGSFWDIETSGIATSPGGGTGLTTEQMTNIDLFFPLANAAGWDFESVWASGARGDYARNLSTSPVLSVFPLPLTVQYGLTDSAVSNGNAFGGPGGLYVFGPLGDSLDLSVLGSPNEFADINAGTTTYRPSTTTLTSSMGQSFDARSITAVATITPAPLTVTADNQAKTEGDTLTFTGTELTASGLFFSDSVTSGVLSSTGAAADAVASATPYPIVFDEEAGLTGTGLSNYTITFQNGELLVVAAPEPPLPETITPVIDPPVTVDTEFEEDGGGGGGTAVNPVDAALATTGTVEELSSDVEEKIAACGKQDQDVSQYLACLADAMDTYAEDLEAIADSLPPGLEDIGDIIRDAVAGVRAAGENAERRLALATTPAERAAIRREALQQARASIRGAQAEIRKAITLIRAEDPELAGLQRVQVETIVAAVGQAEIGLSRVLEL